LDKATVQKGEEKTVDPASKAMEEMSGQLKLQNVLISVIVIILLYDSLIKKE